jgi:hypothetical protein
VAHIDRSDLIQITLDGLLSMGANASASWQFPKVPKATDDIFTILSIFTHLACS